MEQYRERRHNFNEEFHKERTVILEEEDDMVNSKLRKNSIGRKNYVDTSFD